MRALILNLLFLVVGMPLLSGSNSSPNVIILLTDDQGYGDMSCHGNPIVETLEIDRLHRESTRFTQFLVSPLCQPTRSSLMTGRNKVIGRRIEPNEQTLPAMFKRGGYSTAIFGKWHLGEYYPFRPIDKGFDEQLLIGAGALAQVQDYWGNSSFDTWLNNGETWRQYKGYCTDILFNEAMQWIEKQEDKPFFCYLSTNAAHSPFVAPDEHKKPFLDRGLADNAASFYGMIANLDDNLGRLRKHLDQLGIAENTLLIFLTDNGSTMAGEKTGLFNAGLRGNKASIYEGGSRAAAFFNWPGTLKAGHEIDQLAMHYDLLPTLADICEIPLAQDDDLAELDGISLKPFLFGAKSESQERYHVTYQGFWPPDAPLRKYENTSIRSQDYRLANGDELYDLTKDPGEKINIILENPEKAAELKLAYDKWWQSMSGKLEDLRVYNPYPVGDGSGNTVTMCSLHYYDSRVYPDAQKWFEAQFYQQYGLKSLLKDELSDFPEKTPLLGSWKVDFLSTGSYKFTLRKGTASTPESLTVVKPGFAHVRVGDQQIDLEIANDTQAVEVLVKINVPGMQFVECWFDGQRSDGKVSGAYFVDIVKMKPSEEKTNPVELRADKQSKEFASITEAIEASRNYDINSGKTILLGDGSYDLDQTLYLDERDNGLVIKAKEGEEPVLTGGRRLTGWEKGDGDFWTAPAPGTRDGSWNFRTLLVNGRVADRARYPETGRLQNTNSWNVRWMSTAEGGWERRPSMEELTRMVYKDRDLGEWLNLENAELTIFHKWDETLVGVKEIIPEENTVVFSNRVGHPLGAFGVKDYVVWNIEKGMTRPGQWYLDRIRERVVYWPLPGEDMASLEVIAPITENVIRMENTENVVLKGLTIQAASTPLIVGDFGAKMFDGAVSASNASHCKFENLKISGVTGWGMKLFGDYLTVKDSHIHSVGAGAIRLIGSHALIENNYLHDVGKTYPSSIVLYVGVTDPNMKDEWEFGKDETHATLRHNEIHDGPYVGIGIGGSHHIIEFNKIHRVMQELEDGSGIYATFCGDLIMRNNLVRDIPPGPSGQNHAYYLDELSDGVLVENNISINVNAAQHNHMAKNNLLRNNIFISRGAMNITLPRCELHTYERNVFISDESVTFTHPGVVELNSNLFQAPVVMDQKLIMHKREDPVPMKLTGENQIADAGIIIDGDDILFEDDSPALKMGIKPVMGSKAGLISKD
ncbi:MAG: sulfatase-like hydrolase/transferase [Puniceicoccaceae bacterium]